MHQLDSLSDCLSFLNPKIFRHTILFEYFFKIDRMFELGLTKKFLYYKNYEYTVISILFGGDHV
jgi:hypothetical protein